MSAGGAVKAGPHPLVAETSWPSTSRNRSSGAEADTGGRLVIAAVNRCATQNQKHRPLPLREFSAEFALLVACASSKSSAKEVRALSRLDLDWQNFLNASSHHRVIPQVYRRFSDMDGVVPAEVLDRLRTLYLANVRQTLRLTRDLIRVLQYFEAKKIPVLSYKGLALAAMFRGDAERQFSDLDLLVDRVNLQKAKLALSELGYTQASPLSEAQEAMYLDPGYELGFDLPDAKNCLELKWRILPKFYSVDFELKGFFERSVNVDVGGYSARTLSPEDSLLVLCVHAAKHGWSELSLLSDISRLVESRSMDWDKVSTSAGGLGIQRIVGTTFDLFAKLFGSDVYPMRVQHKLANERAAAQALDRLRDRVQIDIESLGYFRLMIGLRERWRDRVRFFFRLLFTPGAGEWHMVRLPSCLYPGYYLVRMWRLGVRVKRMLLNSVASH